MPASKNFRCVDTLLNLNFFVPPLNPALQVIGRCAFVDIFIMGVGRGILRQGCRRASLAVDGKYRTVGREGLLRGLSKGVVYELQTVFVILPFEESEAVDGGGYIRLGSHKLVLAGLRQREIVADHHK